MQPDDTINYRLLTQYLEKQKQDIRKEVLTLAYPIGSVYISDSSSDPKNKLGFGTWSRIEGKFVVGASDTDGDFDLNDTGGAKTHTLTESEMPSHTHGPQSGSSFLTVNIGSGNVNWQSGSTNVRGYSTTGSTGGGSAHNNLPPYKAKYMWERTA